MKVKVQTIPGDNLRPVKMRVNGKDVVYFYRQKTGQLYRPIIRLKEVFPKASLRIREIPEKLVIIGNLDL